jgi:hypothetical protein
MRLAMQHHENVTLAKTVLSPALSDILLYQHSHNYTTQSIRSSFIGGTRNHAREMFQFNSMHAFHRPISMFVVSRHFSTSTGSSPSPTTTSTSTSPDTKKKIAAVRRRRSKLQAQVSSDMAQIGARNPHMAMLGTKTC